MLSVDSDFNINLSNYVTNEVERVVGKFNKNYKYGENEETIESYTSSALNKLLNKIKISSSTAKQANELNKDDITIDKLTELDEIVARLLLHKPKEEIENTGTSYDNLFETIYPVSDNSTHKSTSIYYYINHDHNIYSLEPKTDKSPIKTAQLIFNGNNRTDNLSWKYYNYIQPIKHDLYTPHTGIFMYSFALKPFQFQPSGSCNFSKIDNIELKITQNKTLKNSKINIYALNYNTLKIKNGQCGLAYLN